MYIELKPCPFCGEKNNIDCVDCGITTGTIKGFVKCQNCGATICSTHEYVDAIKLWNRWEKVVQKQPTADVVEIVRCKDCIFSRELDKYEKKLYLDNCVGCTKHSKSYHSLIMEDNDFCSYGERKEVKNNA